MKTFNLTIFLVFFALAFTAQAQLPEAISNPSIPITWLGMDFTKAVYVGPADKFNAVEFQNLHESKINYMMEEQRDKFDLQRYLHKKTVTYKRSFVNDANTKNGLISMQDEVPNDFSEDDISAVVESYSFDNMNGVGVMLIVSCLNKMQSVETAYITYIDLEKKTVLYSKKVEGKASGFGQAAFWLNPVLDMLKTMDKTMGSKTW